MLVPNRATNDASASFRTAVVMNTDMYSETYDYDPVGNVTKLSHGSGGVGWSRYSGQSMTPAAWLTFGGVRESMYPFACPERPIPCRHSLAVAMQHWRARRTPGSSGWRSAARSDVPRAADTSTGGAGWRLTHYQGIWERYTVFDGSTTAFNDRYAVGFGYRRVGPDLSGATAPDEFPEYQWYLQDMVGSITVVLDDTGDWVNREECSPYGETFMGSCARKLYRYNGKERDEETAFYYYGFRYYAPWLMRWTRTDPAGAVDGLNLYAYVGGRPVGSRDLMGMIEVQVSGNEDVGWNGTIDVGGFGVFNIETPPAVAGQQHNPDDYELLVLSMLAYPNGLGTRSDELDRDDVSQNWRQLRRTDEESGLSSTLWQSTVDANVFAVGFEGTLQMRDLDDDVMNYLVGTSRQYRQAIDHFEEYRGVAGSQSTMLLTGHSLGGGLASTVSAYVALTKGVSVRTVTLNAAGPAYQLLHAATGASRSDIRGNTLLSDTITAYHTGGEIVTSVQTLSFRSRAIGDQRTIEPRGTNMFAGHLGLGSLQLYLEDRRDFVTAPLHLRSHSVDGFFPDWENRYPNMLQR